MAKLVQRYQTFDGELHLTVAQAKEHELMAVHEAFAERTNHLINSEHTAEDRYFWLGELLKEHGRAKSLYQKLHEILEHDEDIDVD